jgi:hypothetical protein
MAKDISFAPLTMKSRSRVHGPRRVLKELRRIILKNARAQEYRELTDDDKRWCSHVHEALERLTREGDQVLSGGEDPRDRRRVRKRPVPVRLL